MIANKTYLSPSVQILFGAFCTVDNDCLSPSDSDPNVLGEFCMFNWELFNRPIPPAESPEAKVCAGMYLQAAKYLHGLATAAEKIMKKQGVQMMETWETADAFSGRAHGDALKTLLCG